MKTKEEAAQLLVSTRREKKQIDRLPESSRPADLDAGLAVQSRVAELLGWPIDAWKAGMPPEGRIFLAPIFGPTIQSTAPYPILAHGKTTASIEPEIAFTLGKDLPSRPAPYTEAEVRGAVREVRLVLEILGSRYSEPALLPFPEQLADGLANQGMFVGPVSPGAMDRKLDSFHLKIEGPGTVVLDREGRHPTGHPFPPVVWLANYLSAHGQGLKAGQIVTTGSYAGAVEVPIGVPLRVTYGDLGVLDVEFSAV